MVRISTLKNDGVAAARVARFGALVCALAFVGPAFPETLRPLQVSPLPNVGGKSLTVVEVSFAPGEKVAPHRHGMAFVYAYVLQGKVRSQLAGGPPRTYDVGEGWVEAPGARHLLTENPDKSRPARLLVVFVAPTGEPLKFPDKDMAATAVAPQGSP